MGYICDRAHQHHLDIHETEYRSANNGKSGPKEKTIRKQQKTYEESVAKQFHDGNEDICKKHEENRKINQDHLATYIVDDNLIVVGGKDTDLDYNFYKYRKEKENNQRLADDDDTLSSTCRNDTEYHINKTKNSTLQPISKSLDTIVGYANNFLVKLGKLAQQYVIISKGEPTTTDNYRKICTTNASTTLKPGNISKVPTTTQKTSTDKIPTAVNKINVSSDSGTSKSQSRKNNAINPQATTTPVLVSTSSSPSSSLSTKICSAKTGNNASTAPSDVVIGNCSSKGSITKTTTTLSSSPSSSHHHNSCGLVKHSLCLYAASSIIIALCYLTTPIVAYDAVHPM